jgi:dephospho-CoA kinase
VVKVIGITGGIATGKSTVTKYLLQKGYIVMDSDVLAKEAMLDPICQKQVKQAFDCVTDNQIDRKKLGQIIFHDAKAKKQLEDIIHPYVIQRLQEGIRENIEREIMFLDIPLLFECHLEYLCDTIVIVYCEPKIQVSRLMKRDTIDEAYAKTIIKNQMSLLQKKQKADIVLDNSGLEKDLLQQLQKLW